MRVYGADAVAASVQPVDGLLVAGSGRRDAFCWNPAGVNRSRRDARRRWKCGGHLLEHCAGFGEANLGLRLLLPGAKHLGDCLEFGACHGLSPLVLPTIREEAPSQSLPRPLSLLPAPP